MGENNAFKSPKLMFPDESGNYVTEYIPSELTKFENKINSYLLDRRIKKYKDIYYWHVKHFINPELQKIIDINFILHIANDRNHFKLIDGEELCYYNDILPKYAKELDPFIKFEGMNDLKINTSKSLMQKEPYYVAYKKRWIDTFNYGSDFKLLYHGIDAIKALDIVKTLYESGDDKEKKMARTLGLSLKEFRGIFNEQEEVVSNQIDEYKVDLLGTLKRIYWGIDIFVIGLIILHYVVNESPFYPIPELLFLILKASLIVQIFFVPPYLIVLGISKLIKILYYKLFHKKDPELEAQVEE